MRRRAGIVRALICHQAGGKKGSEKTEWRDNQEGENL